MNDILRMEMLQSHQNLSNDESGDPLGQPALFAGQYHLQHIALQFFHDYENSLRSLEHFLQIDHARMVQVLQDGHFVLKRRFLLRRKPHLVDDLDGHRVAGGSVHSAINDAELTRAQDFVREDLIQLRNVLFLLDRRRRCGTPNSRRSGHSRRFLRLLLLLLLLLNDRHQGLSDGHFPLPGQFVTGVVTLVQCLSDVIIDVRCSDFEAMLDLLRGDLIRGVHCKDFAQGDFLVVIRAGVALEEGDGLGVQSPVVSLSHRTLVGVVDQPTFLQDLGTDAFGLLNRLNQPLDGDVRLPGFDVSLRVRRECMHFFKISSLTEVRMNFNKRNIAGLQVFERGFLRSLKCTVQEITPKELSRWIFTQHFKLEFRLPQDRNWPRSRRGGPRWARWASWGCWAWLRPRLRRREARPYPCDRRRRNHPRWSGRRIRSSRSAYLTEARRGFHRCNPWELFRNTFYARCNDNLCIGHPVDADLAVNVHVLFHIRIR